MEDNIFEERPGTDPKLISILAYITILGWIIAVLMNNPKSQLGSFHIRQSLGILLLGTVSSFIGFVPFMGPPAVFFGSVLAFVLWIIGFVAAIRGEEKEVPVLGEKFQEWFDSL